MPKSIFFLLVLIYLGCVPKSIEENIPPACTCDILKDPQLLSGIEYESIESNRNRAALENPQHVLVDAGLELDESRKIDGNLKFVFPISRKGEGYYIKYNIIPDKVNIDHQRYFIAYCSKFYSYVDPETCQIRSNYEAIFNQEKEALLKEILDSRADPPTPLDPNKSPDTKVKTENHYDFHQQLKRRKSAGHYADLCQELFQFFTPSTTAKLDLKKEIRQARDLYHKDSFADSADILLSVFETHFTNQ